MSVTGQPASKPAARHAAWQTLTKVPQIGAFFWLIKILTTGMGESASDALVNGLGPAVAVPLAFIVFILMLRLQFRAKHYTPALYWFTVAMVAVFGTMAADGVHLLGVPYAISTTLYAIALAVVLWLWHRREGTLSIHSVYTRRRETYYWLTVLATFALGTAAGDFTAASLNLGYLTSGILFGAVILIPAVAHWRFKVNEVFTFWFAYIITRPLGASFADWFGKPKPQGLGLGDSTISLILAGIIILLVGYLQLTHEDSQSKQ
ncbi:MAG TPA: hypothetical protein VHC21_02940 [Candidatus Saccharimonadales bacterium]|nr:hypothetical protein [Candidatus Saccharimonadales bacterium]